MQLCMGEESAARAADFFHIAGVLVDVSVHGHRNLGMPGDALQGFNVYAPRGLQLSQEGVAKHMRGYAFGNTRINHTSERLSPEFPSGKIAKNRLYYYRCFRCGRKVRKMLRVMLADL